MNILQGTTDKVIKCGQAEMQPSMCPGLFYYLDNSQCVLTWMEACGCVYNNPHPPLCRKALLPCCIEREIEQ